ncbi:amino acid/amide ABC transporter substrate-binding protein (HAAT family) [Ornithinimicrobium humiphilum]|uniref:Amino acid/amide ABC transporter substrate-binding protein (HAAT family) n=1 Tax=Ornithinimicrobium humiphilum TaxID=125288 RepID=A0A543KPI7_9MICO|nr:ABC transporter substrate-binding protein [Ornithinimicrobium humiphilum]TQM96989.1 amino acid/amide ABC transporter substrate-binding protein (HAAT family) [Ornithinimicrobium humiphilum]
MSPTSLRSRASVTARGIAALTAATLVLAACSGGGDDPEPSAEDTSAPEESADAGGDATGEAGERDLTLEVGTVLPQTGSLAFLGPPEEAGVLLAAKHINDADLGITVNVTLGDSGDPDNRAYATTVPQLLNAGVNVIVGAASSGVSKLFIDEVVAAERLMISPANTSPDFTTWDDNNLYWRTAPSDLLQGEVLGNLIAQDGVANLGIIYLNDAYGTGLEKVLKETFEAANGSVVASESYNAGDTTFDAQISSVMAQNPDAIALITFEEAKTIIPALDSAGFDTSKLYFVDGNIADYSADFDAGLLEGSKGTQPGPDLGDEFRDALNEVWTAEGNDELTDWNYAAESYDAVILAALAALAANSVDGPDIAAKMQEVSGGTGGGEKATDFASAAQIIVDGGVVDYDGPSGPISFDENGDPTEATIGIFEYDGDNKLVRLN